VQQCFVAILIILIFYSAMKHLLFSLLLLLFFIDSNAQITLIPDTDFEQALIDLGHDTGIPDGSVPTVNISSITNLNVAAKGIYDLTGIEDFTALVTLSCSYNYITTLNLTQNFQLSTLACNNMNSLTSIDVTQNTLLTQLICYYTRLTTLDLSQNVALIHLRAYSCDLNSITLPATSTLDYIYLSGNDLPVIDVTQNPGLVNFHCENNFLTSLDVTQNPILDEFHCDYNQLAGLDVTQNTMLTDFNCAANAIGVLDLTQNIILEFLDCSGNPITFIDVSNIPTLEELHAAGCDLNSLDVTQNGLLETLNCPRNNIPVLDVTQNPLIWRFFCDENTINGLDLTQLSVLSELRCGTNPLNTIDVTQNPVLASLHCNNNQLTSLNVSSNPNLSDLQCQDNQLVALDVSQNPSLFRLNANNNQLISLDLSANPNMYDLDCISNNLLCLNLKNGVHDRPAQLDSRFNSGLLCIEVDSALFSISASNHYKDATTTFNTYCFCQSGFNSISGNIQTDNDVNCVGEGVLSQVIVKTSNGDYNLSDPSGNYILYSDSGTVDIEQLPVNSPLFVDISCPSSPSTHTANFTGIGLDTTDLDFYNEFALCPLLTVDISSNRRRRCFNNTTIVNYCNEGNADTNNVQVFVDFPAHVNIVSADAPYTIDTLGNVVFNIGTLLQGQCGTIRIVDSVSCIGSITGLTQCSRTWITPANDCAYSLNPHIALWDSSSIVINGTCVGDSIIRFVIYNTGNAGSGDMTTTSEYRIYVDGGLSSFSNFQLNGGDSLEVFVLATGETIRMEADQTIGHPGNSNPNFVVEACGVASPSLGYISQFPNDDDDFDIEIDCLPIIDSYDPNDKVVQPQGVTAQNFVNPNQLLDYKIRFQNTGSDTAYKVVIVDTLSPFLDPSTIEWGVSSHTYVPSIIGTTGPALMFTFDNINLVDSLTNELGSQGFIKFKIAPFDSLPNGTEIHNDADIYFDYNDPILTNDAWVTLHDTVLTGGPITVLDFVVPEMICQNYTVFLDASGNASISVGDIDNGSSDNSGQLSLSLDQTNFNCSNIGTNTVVLMGTDQNNNSNSCQSTVTILDTIAPTSVTFPADTSIVISAASCTTTVFWTAPVFADNCSVSYSSSHNSGDAFSMGTTVVTYIFTDSSGNSASDSFEVVVNNEIITDSISTCDSYTWIDGNTYTSSNNTAMHTLTNIGGCDSVVTLDLTITNSSTGIDTQTACNSYIWIDGNTYTSNNNIATHTLTNVAGCDSVVTLNLTINTVDTGVITTDPSITANAAGALYQWLDCDNNWALIAGETNQTFVASANGNYAVAVTLNGCVDTSICVNISTVDITLNTLFDDVSIFPNPTHGLVTINFGELENSTVKVMNANGKLVYQKQNINTSILEFEIKEAAGVYLVEITAQGEKQLFKLVKQ
jgi:uncharacterized repeat protein (TIGR01451 family)